MMTDQQWHEMLKRPWTNRIVPGFGTMTAREGDDPDDPKPDDKFVKAFNKLFHAAMSERDKRDAPKRQKAIEDAVSAAFEKGTEGIVAKMKELIPSKVEPDPDDSPTGDKGKKGAKLDPEIAKQLKTLEDKIAREAKKTDEERQKREFAESKQREQEDTTTIGQMLTEAKVRPGIMRVATKDIRERFIRRDKEDPTKQVWMTEDGEAVDVKKGFAEYQKSDEFKEYLPARDAGGSGGGRPPAGRGGSTSEQFGYADLATRVGVTPR